MQRGALITTGDAKLAGPWLIAATGLLGGAQHRFALREIRLDDGSVRGFHVDLIRCRGRGSPDRPHARRIA